MGWKIILIIFSCLLIISCSSEIDVKTDSNTTINENSNFVEPPTLPEAQYVEEQIMPGIDVDSSSLENELYFMPDSGIRLDYAAQVHVIFDEETKYYYAVHKDTREGNEGGQFIGSNLMHTSTDGLTFDEGVNYERRTHSTDFGLLMPQPDEHEDYFWRRYSLTPEGMKSEITYDGENYVKEEGFRYDLQEDDGVPGYYDLFVNTNGDVILLYISAVATENGHIRLAISTDNGENFEYIDDNPLGDLGKNTLGMNQRDPRFTILPDGDARLFTMVQGGGAPVPGSKARGYIYSWYTADGHSYELEYGIRLRPTDFTEFDVWSLNDPHTIRLSDGRYRIYVTGLIADESEDSLTGYKEVILSATTQ